MFTSPNKQAVGLAIYAYRLQAGQLTGSFAAVYIEVLDAELPVDPGLLAASYDRWALTPLSGHHFVLLATFATPLPSAYRLSLSGTAMSARRQLPILHTCSTGFESTQELLPATRSTTSSGDRIDETSSQARHRKRWTV